MQLLEGFLLSIQHSLVDPQLLEEYLLGELNIEQDIQLLSGPFPSVAAV